MWRSLSAEWDSQCVHAMQLMAAHRVLDRMPHETIVYIQDPDFSRMPRSIFGQRLNTGTSLRVYYNLPEIRHSAAMTEPEGATTDVRTCGPDATAHLPDVL